jgi:hypothetical protein
MALERESRRLERERDKVEALQEQLARDLRKALKDPDSKRSLAADLLSRVQKGGTDFNAFTRDGEGSIGFTDFLNEGPITVDKIGSLPDDED